MFYAKIGFLIGLMHLIIGLELLSCYNNARGNIREDNTIRSSSAAEKPLNSHPGTPAFQVAFSTEYVQMQTRRAADTPCRIKG